MDGRFFRLGDHERSQFQNMPDISRYSDFVEHPRYGRGPRFTMLEPKGDVYIGWHAQGLIPNTAIKADISRQRDATFHFTHYYDLERQCRDCNRQFIFFAAEQKYWYEVLQFGLDSDCVRCTSCRKTQQGLQRTRFEYENLFQLANRSPDQCARMAECGLEMIENNVFTLRHTQKIRTLINELPDGYDSVRLGEIRTKLNAIETNPAQYRG